MRFVISILILLISFNVFGQEGKLRFTRIDTSCQYGKDKFAMLDSFYYDLPDIKCLQYNYYIRIRLEGQILDLYSNDSSTFHGNLTNHISEFIYPKNSDGVSLKYQIIVQRINLDSLVATQVAQIVIPLKNKIDTINKEWTIGVQDCNAVGFYFRSQNAPFLQSCFCPYGLSNDEPYYMSNWKEENAITILDSIKGEFIDALPGGKHYSSTEGYRMLYKLFPKEIAAIENNKPNTDYLKTIKDTLCNYLSQNLTTLLFRNDKFTCPLDCFLRIDKNNKLVDINTNSKLYYREDKREFKKCKKIIREAFKKLEIDFVHSQIGFSLHMLNMDNEIRINFSTVLF